MVTAEGIDGPGASLEGILTDKESCEANKRLERIQLRQPK